MRTVQKVLAENDGSKAIDLILTLLGEVADGRDNLTSTVAEIAQGVLIGKWTAPVKGLAYDLCKAVPLSDADSQYIIAGIKADVNSGDMELISQAFKFLPHLQPHLLAGLLSSGELAQLCSGPLDSGNPVIRAAAVRSLGAALLVPALLSTAADSSGIAKQLQEHWQSLTDALLDDEPDVVMQALSATVGLFQASKAADARVTSGLLTQHLALITYARVSSALGPILQACENLPVQAQLDVLQLLQCLLQQAVEAGHWEGVDAGGALGLPLGTLLPGVCSLAPVVWSYGMTHLHSGHAGLALEAGKVILTAAALTSQKPHSSSVLDASSSAVQGFQGAMAAALSSSSVPVPTDLVLEAMRVVLDLEDEVTLGEAAADDCVAAVVGGLRALPRDTRVMVLHRLWIAIARIKSTPDRIRLCAQAWAAAMADEQAGSVIPAHLSSDMPNALNTSPANPELLASLLADHYLQDVITGASAATATTSPHRTSGPGAPPSPDRTSRASSMAASTAEMIRRKAADVTAPPATANLTPAAVEAIGGRSKSRFFGLIKSKSSKGKERDMFPSTSAKSAPPAHEVALHPQAQAYEQQTVADATGTRGKQGVPSFGSQRHELVATLLSVLALHHPAAQLAAQLCADVTTVAAHDQAAQSSLGGKYGPWQQRRVLNWLTTVRHALAATSCCLLWEPLVIPAISPNVNPIAAQRAHADFSTSVPDLWLQLVQAAASTAYALHTLHKATGATLTSLAETKETPPADSKPAGEAGKGEGQGDEGDDDDGNSSTSSESSSSSSSSSGSGSPKSTKTDEAVLGDPLAVASLREVKELGTIMKGVLREWGVLSRAVRPRALWALGHSLDMAPHADEQWELGLQALQDVLCKLVPSGALGRVADLLGSAAHGVMYQSGRLGWPRDRPFVFDLVSASALCERADYEASALVVGLAVAQLWAQRLQDALGVTTMDTVKRVSGDVVFQAGRLDNILRDFMFSAEAPGNPVLREWCKRIIRSLAATAVFVHPAQRLQEEAEAAAKREEEEAERAAKKAANGDEPHDAFNDSSSDDSSSYDGTGGGDLLPVSLPTTMYLKNVPQPRPALGGPAGGPAAFGAARPGGPAGMPGDAAGMNGFAGGVMAGQPGSPMKQDGNRDQESFKSRATGIHGPLPVHMVPSGTSAHPWGYPFSTTPRASTLFPSRRARRARTLATHLAQAMAGLRAAGPTTTPTAGAGGLSSYPIMPTHSIMRLDNPAFWSLLPVTTTSGALLDAHPAAAAAAATTTSSCPVAEVELCGPGDPVMVVGSVVRSPDASHFILHLTLTNRSGVEVRGAQLSVTGQGPVQLDRRAVGWSVPRLAPHDKASQRFTLKVLGVGCVRLQVRMQLLMTGSSLEIPVLLPCKPLDLGLLHYMVLEPAAGTPEPHKFFSSWNALPVAAELTGGCVWPGREGAALALSAIMRSPLVCVMMNYIPAAACYRAAFAGETSEGDDVLLLVHAQLLPPPNTPNIAASFDIAAPASAIKGKGSKGDKGDKQGDKGSAQANGSSGKQAAAGKAAAGGKAGDDKAGAGSQGAAALALPAAGPGDVARLAHANIHIMIRSSLPDVVHAIQMHPWEFMQDLCQGAVSLPGYFQAGPALCGAAGPKPPMHPRVAALDAALVQSVRALPPTTQALLGGSPAAGPGAGVDVYAQGSKAGSKVSHRWMEAAAAAEWQRLVSQPV